MSISRRKLRELCMQLVYQYDFYPNPELSEQVEAFLLAQDEPELSVEDKQKVRTRITDLYEHMPAIDAIIEENAEGWKISRMSKVDLSMLRLAVYELRFDDDIPDGVAINEAVELAKIYGGEHSYQFINGVLSKVVKKDA